MPNQNDPNQNNQNQPTDSGATPVIFPQADLPPLPPDFQDVQDIQNVPPVTPADPVGVPPEPPITTTTTTTTTSVAPDTTQAGSAAPQEVPDGSLSPMTTSSPKKKFGGGKIIATILGLLLLVGGIGTGVLLTGQNQNPNSKADNLNCDPPDPDDNCTRCQLLDYCKNSGCSYEWVHDCEGKTDFKLIAECRNIKAYSTDWVLLNDVDLTKLRGGNQVNFCATGFTNSNLPFSMARFTINGVLRPETSATRPGGVPNEFCDLYTIPEGVTTFVVSAELKIVRIWR
ncbi:MAG: hypothetical protein HYV90_01435 [Candidatus Woesebacteria bacterium]|nr:MAG: hypothetical protein HYV90_01435 [Candidatus Woesebacteria bacterium]